MADEDAQQKLSEQKHLASRSSDHLGRNLPLGVSFILDLSICKVAKWLSGEALQIAVKRREAKSKGERERYKHLNAEFQRIARRDKKAFLSDQCKEREGKTEWERLEIFSRKLEIPREHFMQRWA